MVTRFAGHNQIGQRFEITPQIKKDGIVEDLNLDGHTSLSVLIKQPDGTILERNAGVKGELLTEILVGRRIDDPSLTVATSNLNDGNDGGGVSESVDTTISVSPLNTNNKTTSIEIEPGYTLFFRASTGNSEIGRIGLEALAEPWEGDIILTGTTKNDEFIELTQHVILEEPYHFVYLDFSSLFPLPRLDFTKEIGIRNNGLTSLNITRLYSPTFLSSWSEGFLRSPNLAKPFTYLYIQKNETLILKDLVTRNISIEQNLYFYVRGAAFPFILVEYYLNDTQQTFDILSGLDFPLVGPGDRTFDELHITVLETTNGGGIELGGISEYFQSTEQAYSIQSWDEAFLTSVAEYPFDENLNTEIQLAAGEWYFESVGDKEVKRIAVTRAVGTINNPDVEISTFIDGFKVIIGNVTPQLTNGIPTYIDITDEPRPFESLTLTSTESFQLHELEVEGQTESFANDSTIFYTDPQGLLTQKGLYEYKVKVVYDNGNTIISYNSGAFFVK